MTSLGSLLLSFSSKPQSSKIKHRGSSFCSPEFHEARAPELHIKRLAFALGIRVSKLPVKWEEFPPGKVTIVGCQEDGTDSSC